MGVKEISIAAYLVVILGMAHCETYKSYLSKCSDQEIYGKCLCIDEERGHQVRVQCEEVSVEDAQKILQKAKSKGKVFVEFYYSNKDVEYLPKRFLNGSIVWKLVLRLPHLRSLEPKVFKGGENHIYALHIKSSSLKEIPVKVMNSLENLDDFAFEESQIEEIKSKTFRKVKNPKKYKHLSLAKNGIREVERKSLRNFINLHSISLAGNLLRYLSSRTLPVKKIESINLDENPMKRFPYNLIHAISKYGWLSLRDCRVRKVHSKDLSQLIVRKVFVNLDENPVKCNCDFGFFAEALKDDLTIFGRCRSPKNVAYRKLNAIRSHDFEKCEYRKRK